MAAPHAEDLDDDFTDDTDGSSFDGEDEFEAQFERGASDGLDADGDDEDGLVEEAVDDDDDDYEEEEEDGDEIVGVPAAPAAPPAGAPPRDWSGLSGMPDPTRDRIEAALDRLAAAGRDGVSVLVVGAPGGGKSALTNALLNERVATLHPLTRELERPVLAAREADLGGGTRARVQIIDTPGLADGDGPSPDAARALGGALAGRPLDAVLYVDRLDGYPVDESDVELMRLYTANLGPDMWDRTLIVLTHARMTAVPGGGSFDDYAAERAESLRRAARAAGARKGARMQALLADTASRAPTNEDGEPLLLDNNPWVPTVWESVVDVALDGSDADGKAAAPPPPFRPDPASARKAADPDRKRRWLVPLALAAQVAAAAFLRSRVLPADGARGDRDGPFDPDVAASRLAALKASWREEGRDKKRATAAATARPRAAARRRVVEDSDSD